MKKYLQYSTKHGLGIHIGNTDQNCVLFVLNNLTPLIAFQ